MKADELKMGIAEDDFAKTYLGKLGSLDLLNAECLPDFLVISPGKTGTTWLYQNLYCHEEIYIPRKEINYFNINWKVVDVNWYTRQFQDKLKFIKGDVSPGYTVLPTQVIRLIKWLMPDLKLIFLMRDPVDRAWSHVRYSIRYNDFNFTSYDGDFDSVPEERFIEHFTAPYMLAYNDYLGILQRWLAFFPKDQFYVGFYESIKSDPQRLLREIFEHLGVKKDVDWQGFKTGEKIFTGIKREITDGFKQILRFIWKERTEELTAFLRSEFQIKDIPNEWSLTLAEGNATPVLVEKDFKGFGIIQNGDRLYGSPAETLNSDNGISLTKEMDSHVVEGRNIYQIWKRIAQLNRSWIWNEFDQDAILLRIADDITFLSDKRYMDVFTDVIDNDYLIRILTSTPLMSEIILENNFKGFTIVYYMDKLYALDRALGTILISAVDENTLQEWQKANQCFTGNTIKDIENLINGLHSCGFERTDAVTDQLNDLVNYGEGLFANGETDKAYSGFAKMLSRINEIRETIINDIAVILVQEGDVDEAERLLLSLLQEGNNYSKAAINLEIIRDMRGKSFFQNNNVPEQASIIAVTKEIAE